MSSPVASTSNSIAHPSIVGLFDRPAAPEHRDLEAQYPPIAPPSPVRTQSPRALRDSRADPVDAFFGLSSTQGTRDSRHDDLRVRRHELTPAELVMEMLPPSYESSIAPPAYTQVSDQPTLAMYLFKYGFLFPLFWVAGACILLSPLRAPDDWEAAKSEHERQELIQSIRRTEVRWATRCLCALLVLLLAVISVTFSTAFIMRS